MNTDIRKSGYSLEIGFVNRHGQIVIRRTDQPGTDHNARIIQLGCTQCGLTYGANSGDVWERRCPRDGGAEGLEFDLASHS